MTGLKSLLGWIRHFFVERDMSDGEIDMRGWFGSKIVDLLACWLVVLGLQTQGKWLIESSPTKTNLWLCLLLHIIVSFYAKL